MPAGRPKAMTEEALSKIEEAFSNGATDLEACFLANISKDTLYRYQNDHPEFSERKQALKDMIKFQAKKVVANAIKRGDKQQANWWLERKAKNEGFSSRQEITGPDGKELGTPIYGGKSTDETIQLPGHSGDTENISTT